MSKQWEYQTDQFEDHLYDDQLNAMGEQGWEVIYVRCVALDHMTYYTVMSKRKKLNRHRRL